MLDSQSGKPWSSITGTSPLGFIARYSGDCVPPNAPPTSIDSYGAPISSAHHSTLRTLLELRRPQIFSMVGLSYRAMRGTGVARCRYDTPNRTPLLRRLRRTLLGQRAHIGRFAVLLHLEQAGRGQQIAEFSVPVIARIEGGLVADLAADRTQV